MVEGRSAGDGDVGQDGGHGEERGRARVPDGAWSPVRPVAPGIVLILAGTAAFVALLAGLTDHDGLWALDEPLLEWFVAHRTPAVTAVLTVVTTLFGPFVLPVLVALGCLVWARRSGSWREPGLLAGAMVLATIISSVAKALVARPRPPGASMVVPGLERSFSFPSGHTIGAATLVLVGGYLVWRRHRSARVLAVWMALSVVVIGVVALSRLYLGYHFLTDVLAGASLAVAVLGVVVCVDRWLMAQAAHTARGGRPDLG